MNPSTSRAEARSKPFLRGHLHQAAFFGAVGACSVLIAVAEGSRERIAAVIYSLSLAGLYGISSLYHRPHWSDRVRPWMRRLDHSAIFVLMAGTATPLCMLGMNNDVGIKLLYCFWIAALLGILKVMFWVNSPRLVTASFYLAVGWMAAPYVPEIAAALGQQKLLLVVSGGLIYTAGAIVYALKKPDPFPKIFGYHEIFHALVIVASLLHFIVIYQLIR
jgi:hemolysin III